MPKKPPSATGIITPCGHRSQHGKMPWTTRPKSAEPKLLGRVAEGDTGAMEALYARYNIPVFRFVLQLVGDETLAEDLVSEVFLTVWQNAGRFQGRSQESSWIFGIARIKALSARHRRRHKFDKVDAATIPDTTDNPEISLQTKDDVALLGECMIYLSRKHREVIDLIYYREKSLAEAARILGVSKNTVKTRTFYARKRMSELLVRASIDWSSK